MTAPAAAERGRTLPFQPPRDYRLRDAYRRRVWRDPGSMIARDLLWVGIAMAGAGLAWDESAFMLLGAVVAGGALLLGALATLAANLRRVALVRGAPAVKGRLGRAKRVLLLHEFFRGRRERTFAIPYTFEVEGRRRRGTLWICGCARDRLTEGREAWIAYDPRRRRRSLPLRVANMIAPH